MVKEYMFCSCCGGYCKGRQWWNRDKGFGLCPSCANRLKSKAYSTEEMKDLYGVEGYHYFTEEVKQCEEEKK